MTGLPLAGKVTLRVDTELRKEVLAWLRQQGLNADAVRAAVLRDRHNTDDHGEPLPLLDAHHALPLYTAIHSHLPSWLMQSACMLC